MPFLARKLKWDIFGDFETLCLTRISSSPSIKTSRQMHLDNWAALLGKNAALAFEVNRIFWSSQRKSCAAAAAAESRKKKWPFSIVVMMEIPHVMLDKREAFFLHYPHATSDDWINLGAHQITWRYHKKGCSSCLVKTSQYSPIYTIGHAWPTIFTMETLLKKKFLVQFSDRLIAILHDSKIVPNSSDFWH